MPMLDYNEIVDQYNLTVVDGMNFAEAEVFFYNKIITHYKFR